MIDETKTFETFGYYSKEVARTKIVVALCQNCNQTRTISKAAALKSKQCNYCQRVQQAAKNAKINRIGRTHTAETKAKIGAANYISQKRGKDSPRYGVKISESHKEAIRTANKNRVWTTASKNKIRKSRLGVKSSIETKLKMSKMRLEKPTRIGHVPAHGKGDYYLSKTGISIWMRSSWEIKIAKHLDESNLSWEYEPYAFPITFIYNSIQKHGTYRPDFKVVNKSGIIEYWEVKGWWRDDAKVKYEAFLQQHNPIIKLIQKAEMIELGLL